MNKIVLLNSLSKEYIDFQKKVKQNHKTIDNIKLFIVISIFVFTIWLYWYFVNINSTMWYFYRNEWNKVEEIKLFHNITQLNILKSQKLLWDDINSELKIVQKKDRNVKIDNKIIYLKYNQELVKNIN
jgi:hypothetical protein